MIKKETIELNRFFFCTYWKSVSRPEKASRLNYLDDQLGSMKNNVKINKYESAESVNNWWKNQGYDQPPYTPKTVVQ